MRNTVLLGPAEFKAPSTLSPTKQCTAPWTRAEAEHTNCLFCNPFQQLYETELWMEVRQLIAS